MKFMSTLTALTLIAMLAILPGCGETAPPEDIKVVKSAPTEETPAEEAPAEEAPAEEAPAAEMPAEEAPAEEAPVEETPAEEMPAEEAPAPAETPAPEAAAVAGPATYAITPNDENTLGFTGYKVTGNQQGSWGEYNGTVVVTDGNLETTKINIAFDMTSIFTTASMLTETLHNAEWFNIGEHPEATFTSSSVKKTDEGYDVAGQLIVRGVTTNITFPATITVEGDTLKAQADFALLRSDWGMTDTGLADDLVKDEVRITFDIVAEKQ